MEHYSSLIKLLEANIDVDLEKLGGHKPICIDMIDSIPLNLRNCVSTQLSTCGSHGDYNYELFIENFNEKFEDKTTARTAGK